MKDEFLTWQEKRMRKLRILCENLSNFLWKMHLKFFWFKGMFFLIYVAHENYYFFLYLS